MTAQAISSGSAAGLSDTPVAKAWPVALGGFAVWLAAVAINAPLKLDHDVSYFLMSGRILNDGDRLYTDWIDFNTTAPSSLGRFSDWLAAVLSTPLDLTHKATILLCALLGLAVAFAVLLPELRKPGAPRWALALGIPVVLLLATPEIGRREQLVCIAVTGWVASIVLASCGVRRPWPVMVAAGVIAGLGLYAKPHFILFGIALGLVDLIRARGRFDQVLLSTWITAGTSTALYLCLFLAYPDFLGVMLPATVDLYGSLAPDWLNAAGLLAKTSLLRGAGLGLAVAVLILGTGNRPTWTAIASASTFIGVAALLYVQQRFGFEYHRLPLDIAFNMTCIGLLAWGLGADRTSARRVLHLGGVTAAAVLLAGAMVSQLHYISRYPNRSFVTGNPLLEAMRPPRPGDPILIITTHIHPTAEVFTLLDARWSGAFVSHFPIPALIRQDGRDGLRRPLPEDKRVYWTKWFREKVAEKFCMDPPVRVAAETTTRPVFFQNSGFDMLAWLREEPAFDSCWRAAGLTPVGDPVATAGLTYQVYARKPDVTY